MSKLVLRETPYEVTVDHPIKLLPEKKIGDNFLVRNTSIYDIFRANVDALENSLVFSTENSAFLEQNSSYMTTLLGISCYSLDSNSNPVILRKSLLEINTNTTHEQLEQLVRDIISKPLITENTTDERNVIKGLDAVYAYRSTQSNIYDAKNNMISKYQDLFDESFSSYNVRALGSNVVTTTNKTDADGSYKIYSFDVESPFYTVLTDDTDPKMRIMSRSFIIPLERFKQSNTVYIFKYPEWLIGDKKELNLAIDSGVLEVAENKNAIIYSGSTYFGTLSASEYFNSNNTVVSGNMSLLNYTNHHNFLQTK